MTGTKTEQQGTTVECEECGGSAWQHAPGESGAWRTLCITCKGKQPIIMHSVGFNGAIAKMALSEELAK